MFFRPDATNEDMLRSILHAALVRGALSKAEPWLERSEGESTSESRLVVGGSVPTSPSLRSILSDTHEGSRNEFPLFKNALENRGWRTDELCFADLGHRVTWTR